MTNPYADVKRAAYAASRAWDAAAAAVRNAEEGVIADWQARHAMEHAGKAGEYAAIAARQALLDQDGRTQAGLEGWTRMVADRAEDKAAEAESAAGIA